MKANLSVMSGICLQKNADCRKILLCAPSNAGIDELCRRLKQRNGFVSYLSSCFIKTKIPY